MKEEEGQGVELGMMKGEVREILGDPYRTQNLDASGTKKKWFYLSSWNDKVVDAYIFEGGILTDIETEIPNPSVKQDRNPDEPILQL